MKDLGTLLLYTSLKDLTIIKRIKCFKYCVEIFNELLINSCLGIPVRRLGTCGGGGALFLTQITKFPEKNKEKPLKNLLKVVKL